MLAIVINRATVKYRLSSSLSLRLTRMASTFPSTIQSITIAKAGGLEVLEKTSVPFPEVKDDHVVVKIDYGGVNFIDTYFRSGLYPLKSFPAQLGTEAAGVIVGLPQDEKVLRDEDFKKRNYKQGGKVAVYLMGSHAEYVSLPWRMVVPVPDSLSTKTAAAALVQAGTAISFMDESYDVQRGDTVFVHTVAGGLGLMFAQYAKHKGATVIGTTSTSAKAEEAKANGADHVLLYRQEDVVARTLEITGGEGVNAIFDGVGKDTFENNFKMIKRKGTIVCVGNASGAVPPFAPLKLVEKNVKILRPTFANYAYSAEEVLHYGNKMFGLIADGVLKVKIFKEYPFSQDGVKDAQNDLTGGKTVGKLLIKISED